jgi:transcriptional regulator with XRE-family HTH domain
MDNIVSDKDYMLDKLNPASIAKFIAQKCKKRRMELNVPQLELAQRSGVSYGSLKRFEKTAEISLKNLLMIALVLNATEDFLQLFSKKQYKNISDVVLDSEIKTRKRARR